MKSFSSSTTKLADFPLVKPEMPRQRTMLPDDVRLLLLTFQIAFRICASDPGFGVTVTRSHSWLPWLTLISWCILANHLGYFVHFSRRVQELILARYRRACSEDWAALKRRKHVCLGGPEPMMPTGLARTCQSIKYFRLCATYLLPSKKEGLARYS